MTYRRADIERLIPGIWDEWRVLEKRLDTAPDPEMPKGTSDPRRSTDAWAALADIQRAWKLAGLTLRQRQAVLLVHALDYTHEEAARSLGVSRPAVSQHAEAGVGRLMFFLNGEEELTEEALAEMLGA